jgi:hypothetical protein
LIALERGSARVRALLSGAERIVIPAGVVAQVWRGSPRQAPIAAVLRGSNTTIEPLDEDMARVVGVICADTGTGDIVDASVAFAGLVHRAVVITSDPDDLRRIAPGLDLEVC